MDEISVVGVDLGQSTFFVHGADRRGKAVVVRKLNRERFTQFLAQLEPCVVGMESGRGAHYWGRVAQEYGHEVRLVSPRQVKPYVTGNKNDWRDAEAIAEAVCRARVATVPVKTVEQQAVLMLHAARSQAVRARTSKANQIRAHLHELGVVMARGIGAVRRRVSAVLEEREPYWPGLAVRVLRRLYEEFCALDEQVGQYNAEVRALAKSDPVCQRLMTIPGVGPLAASALAAKVGDGRQFRSARHLAAWLGLVPRQHGTGGRTHLFGISKRGDAYMRSILVHGARAVLQRAGKHEDRHRRWAQQVALRRGHNVACVALANKMARIAWAMLRSGECFRAPALA